MTTANRFSDRNRDQQDGYERGLWGEIEYVEKSGAVLKVRGTGVEDGTLDEEVPLINTGYAFNVPKDYNTEVLLFSLGSDTNQKYAMTTLPRDKQRQWPENTGGIQHPTNAAKFVQLDDDSIWLHDGVFHLGNDKDVKVTVSGGNATVEVNTLLLKVPTINIDSTNVNIKGDLDVVGNVTTTGELRNNGTSVGSDHVHTGVDPGGSNSGPPLP